MSSSPDNHNGIILLQRIATGDEQAFASLYRFYNKRIYSAAMHYLRNETLAEEMVQEVFLKIWQRKEKMATVENPNDYIFIMARNSIFTCLQKQALELTLREKATRYQKVSVNDADHTAQQRDYDALLHLAIQQLPEQRRKVYLLAKEQGLSYMEIAAVMGISSLTVKKQITLANRQVRTYINQHLHSFLVVPLFYAEFLA